MLWDEILKSNMNLKVAILILLFFHFNQSQAETADTTYWLAGGFGSITYSQVMLKNWAGGGQPSVAINWIMGAFFDYKRDRITWENSYDFAYGLVKQGNNGSLLKSDDKINIVSKVGYKIQKGNEKWYYSGLLDFRTQFAKGFEMNPKSSRRDSVISKFMTPGYVTVGLGADYKPNDKLSFNYIPVTGKFTFVNDQRLADKEAYGVPKGKKARGEFGSYFRVKYKGEIMKNVNMDSRLELFSNYTKEFGTIDVNIQNTFVMKVNKFLTANFYAQMVYDKDIRNDKDRNNDGEISIEEMKARMQYKSVIGLGLSHKIGAEKKKK